MSICEECQQKHLSSLYSLVILVTEYQHGYQHLEAALAHLHQAEKEGFTDGNKLHNTEWLKDNPEAYKQYLYDYLDQYFDFPSITGFLTLAEEKCTNRETLNLLRKTRKQIMGDQDTDQYSRGKAREKRLQQLQDLEERAEKQGTQDDLERIRNFRQDLLNGKYSYCNGNAEAQKLIHKIGRQINKRQ